MKKIFFSLILMMATMQLFAQDNGVEMADSLRSNGKIYVVVICIVIILVGLLAYLFSIDRRLKKIEKENHISDK
ncbi:CcmD family protein [Pedobacter suwonensis]|nr:CcmD family protein [Pedobacter suwonensis]